MRFTTWADQGLKTGYATVTCSEDVIANNIIEFCSANGTKLSETTVFSAIDYWELLHDYSCELDHQTTGEHFVFDFHIVEFHLSR